VPKALRARRVNRRLTLPAGAVLLTHAGMWMRFGANSAAFGSRVVVQLPCLRMQEPSPGGCSWRHRCAQPPLSCRRCRAGETLARACAAAAAAGRRGATVAAVTEPRRRGRSDEEPWSPSPAAAMPPLEVRPECTGAAGADHGIDHNEK
jgi:hypothetical protein